MTLHREFVIGVAKSASGRLKSAFGKATNNDALVSSGRSEVAEGRIRMTMGSDTQGRRR